MSEYADFDPFIHPPLKAEQRERLRAEGVMGPADRELTFGQVLDVINPLQHIPVVGTLYRALTGDTMDSTASVVGSVIYGGPIGLVAGLVGAVVEQASGRDVGGLALAVLNGEEISAPVAAAAGQVAEQAAGAAADATVAGLEAGVATAGQMAAAAAGAPESEPAAAERDPPPAPTPAPAAAPAAGQQAAATRPEARAPAAGEVFEGADALAALAADLRAAVASPGSAALAAPAGAGREEAPAPTAHGALRATAPGPVPPPESFMPLSQRDVAGPALARQMSAAHAADTGPLAPRQAGLYPTSLSRASERRQAPASQPAGGPASEPSSEPAGASSGIAVAPGLLADPRFAAGIAPQAGFADRMMEALNKYQALSGPGAAGSAVN